MGGIKYSVKTPAKRKKDREEDAMFTRRHLIKAAGAGLALTGSSLELGSARAAGAAIDLPAALPEGARNNAMLDSLPGKKPIKLSYRPPNYETRSNI